MPKTIFMFTLIFSLKLHADPACSQSDIVPQEILIKFRSEIKTFHHQEILKGFGHRLIKKIPAAGFLHLKIADNETVVEAIEKYKANDFIEFAEPNYIMQALRDPSDTYYGLGYQWHHKNYGQNINSTVCPACYTTHNPGTSGADISTPAAWDVTTDCSSTLVGVVDTGVLYNHEDLQSNMWNGGGSYPNHGKDIVNNDNDPTDDATNFHGTMVASLIGAVGNNSKGIAGVCWQANLMAIKVMGSDLSGSVANVSAGIDFAVQQGAKILNLSLGMASNSQTLTGSLTNARTNGVLVTTAAGNDGNSLDSNTMYPCMTNLDNIICVANLDQALERNTSSNYSSTYVDLGAPGTNIAAPASNNTSYAITIGGTSMAAPLVAGVAALIWNYNPNFTYLDVRIAIEDGVRAVTALQPLVRTGGALNAFDALKYINKPSGLSVIK